MIKGSALKLPQPATYTTQSLGGEEKGEWTMRYAVKGGKGHEK